MPFAQSAAHGLNARRFEICMTAARTFVERGFDATSVNDIAAALGVTKAGLYHYISSKEQLFLEIVNLGMDWLDHDVVKPTQGIADPEERLRQLIERHATLTACNEGWITILLDEMHALPAAQRKKLEQRKRNYLDLVKNTLIELKKAGRLRSIDPTVATFATLGMIIWLPRWVRPGGRLSPEQVASEVAKLAMNGLLKPQPAEVRRLPRKRTIRRRGSA
jgi:TetR/AcrR family transcriptional regulator, cholesterol catabolism regulator